MANTAAHLVDRVLPNVPIRQWVLSLPLLGSPRSRRAPRTWLPWRYRPTGRPFPVVARIGAPTVRKHWEGIDIETTKRALGPFVVVITRHDNQSTAGWAIQQPDCSEEGVNPGRDDMAFYMLGTAALQQKDDVFVLTVIGPKSENAVAFTKR